MPLNKRVEAQDCELLQTRAVTPEKTERIEKHPLLFH